MSEVSLRGLGHASEESIFVLRFFSIFENLLVEIQVHTLADFAKNFDYFCIYFFLYLFSIFSETVHIIEIISTVL